ncbi:MAG: Na/Pi cotransporter family protein [Lachnospiraceae bacterium]
MDVFNLISMIGGLALFLYGMDLMGDGLSRASGGKMEKILEGLTSNPLKAVLLGAGVTAVIQSSSATTVIVVGFVNSGIMKLQQAVGIIMGANIGTTVTSWILSLSGIQSDSLFIRMLKPSSFAPILAMIGVVLLVFLKSEKKKHIGMIMVGFSILMTGMDAMSAAVKPLANVPEFTGILTMFSNPVLGMLAGAVLTAIIQSSSASVGILQALCMTGAVSFKTALPIIMGQNIGTCITAMISGIGGSKNARRTALIHLYFNLIGTTVFMIVFYTVNAFRSFEFLNTPATAAGIAVIHSIFNISATAVLLPFSKVLVKLACLTIRDDEKTEKASALQKKALRVLDPRFLDMPAYAAEICHESTLRMAHLSKKSIVKALELFDAFDERKAREIIDLEEEVDLYEDELGTYMVAVCARDLSGKDSQTLSVLLHSIGDFERISDHAVTIRNAAEEMNRKGLAFSEDAQNELRKYVEKVLHMVDMTMRAFKEMDMSAAENVLELEKETDSLNVGVKKQHIKRLRDGKCTIELGFILSDVTTALESIADHCSNVAQTVLTYH